MAWHSLLHRYLGSTLIIPQKLLSPGFPVAPCGCIQWIFLSLWIISSSSALGSLHHFLQELCNGIHKMFFLPLWPLCRSDCSSSPSWSCPLNAGICQDCATDLLPPVSTLCGSSDQISLLSFGLLSVPQLKWGIAS